jgi:hypothetical protein
MKYSRQVQENLDRLDQSLARLRTMIKRGENEAAVRFMVEGELKDRFADLQNLITLSKQSGNSGGLGASGVSSLGTI